MIIRSNTGYGGRVDLVAIAPDASLVPFAFAFTSSKALAVSAGPISRSTSGVRTPNDNRKRAQSIRYFAVSARTPSSNMVRRAAAAGVST
jgi:hypothetical protein